MKKITSIITIITIVFFSISVGAYLYKYGYISKYLKGVDFLSNKIEEYIKKVVRTSVKGVDLSNFKIITNNYEFSLNSFDTGSMYIYGGIDIYNEKLFFLDGMGNLNMFDNNELIKIDFPNFDFHVNEFKKDFGLNFPDFSIKDLAFGKVNNKDHIFISYTDYDSANKCYFLSVAQSEIIKSNDQISFGDFKIIFNSKPCLSPHPKNGIRGFAGTSAGGRLSPSKDGIYVSIGDFYFDGVNAESILNFDKSDYGKIIYIEFNTINYSTIAYGLRNPQGMVLTDIGLFETEHGPQGGDEFNKINLNQITDFGWPNASFGVDYETYNWPLDQNNRNHIFYQNPIYFWTPSIGISNIDFVDKTDSLQLWSGDFIISSLKSLSLYRVRMESSYNHLIGIEKIQLGFRIRDLKIHQNKIYLLEDTTPVKIHILEKMNH